MGSMPGWGDIMTTSIVRDAVQQAEGAARFAGHQAQFWVQEEGGAGCEYQHFWICDGAVRVGLVVRGMDCAELVNFDPLQPRTGIEFPSRYHAPTQPGDRVTLAKWQHSFSTTSDDNELSFETTPTAVSALFKERWNDGTSASQRVTWRVDDDFGYVMNVQSHLASPRDEVWEYCNYLPRGATDDRPGYARYNRVMWQHPDGRLLHRSLNNVGARALGALDTNDRRRIANGGFIGFCGEPDHNPTIELLNSNPGSTAMTCPNMLDEHLKWLPAEVEARAAGADGLFRYSAAFNLLSLPGRAAAALLCRAAPLDMVLDRADQALENQHAFCINEYPYRRGAAKSLDYFYMQRGEVTDFSKRLDAAAPLRGQVFVYPEDDADAPVAIVTSCAHVEGRSLRLHTRPGAAGTAPEPLVAGPDRGNCFHVTPGRRHRFSAWVKTDLHEDATLTLCATEFLYSRANITAVHRSTPLCGQSDWRQLAVEFVPGTQGHVVELTIALHGTGTAWSDEWLFAEL
jgi:hypothetical protein